MTIYEYCDILNVDLKATYYNNQNMRWSVQLERTEVMQGCGLLGAHGNGKTLDVAINDYLNQIRGKRIAINAFSDNRREFQVPEGLTL